MLANVAMADDMTAF